MLFLINIYRYCHIKRYFSHAYNKSIIFKIDQEKKESNECHIQGSPNEYFGYQYCKLENFVIDFSCFCYRNIPRRLLFGNGGRQPSRQWHPCNSALTWSADPFQVCHKIRVTFHLYFFFPLRWGKIQLPNNQRNRVCLFHRQVQSEVLLPPFEAGLVDSGIIDRKLLIKVTERQFSNGDLSRTFYIDSRNTLIGQLS